MYKSKIINDPVYGFISIKHPIILDIIDHPYFQRLRRIKQTGLTYYVYPGATHTRFQHALGAYHLMCLAIDNLRSKGVEISSEEEEGVCLAIVLHDIGHGPFSHTLEHLIFDVHHEKISLLIMQMLDQQFEGALHLAIKIFSDTYHRKFLNQLVSSQLDMDRVDYLTRDSFFSGVAEGVIGYDRILKMLAVVDDQLVVEEKGIYSVERFLTARKLMYWQVYMHKTSFTAEMMLKNIFKRAFSLSHAGILLNDDRFRWLVKKGKKPNSNELEAYLTYDDSDIITLLKLFGDHEDFIIRYLCRGLLDRQLLNIKFGDSFYKSDMVEELKLLLFKQKGVKESESTFLIFHGIEKHVFYEREKDEIMILRDNSIVSPATEFSQISFASQSFTKAYLCFPKFLDRN